MLFSLSEFGPVMNTTTLLAVAHESFMAKVALQESKKALSRRLFSIVFSTVHSSKAASAVLQINSRIA